MTFALQTTDTRRASNKNIGASLVGSVAENAKFYSKRQLARAKAARVLLHSLGCPSVNDLKKIIKMNTIRDNPVTIDDVLIAEKIYGPDIASLKGKTTRRKNRVVVNDVVQIPKELTEAQHRVELCMDTMFVNSMPFLTTISKNIRYRTAQRIKKRRVIHYTNALESVIKWYTRAGFKIAVVHCDREFKPVLDAIRDKHAFTPNYSSAQEHEGSAERNNRVLKERIRATYHRSPFSTLPKRVIEAIVTESAKKLNYFPAEGGCSEYYSPREILHQARLQYDVHCKIPMLSYVLAHNEPKQTNSMSPRALDCLYISPVENTQGGHECYHIQTRSFITRAHVTQVPIPSHIIEEVDRIGAREGIKSLKIHDRKTGSIFYDPGSLAGVEEGTDDSSDSNSDESSDSESESDDDSSRAGVDQGVDPNDIYDDSIDPDPYQGPNQAANQVDTQVDHQSVATNDSVRDSDNDSIQSADADDDDDADSDDEPKRSTRVRHAPSRLTANSLGHLHAQTYETFEYSSEEASVLVMILCTINERAVAEVSKVGAQFVVTYSLKQGIKKFGERGRAAARKEMKQLHDRTCFRPVHKSTLNATERQRTLRSLIFLNEKRDETIKARHCADGSTQRTYMDREAVSSPTVMTESTLLTAVIDAQEGRDVATCDIPNAFVQTEVPERDQEGNRLIMRITGACVDILCEVDPDYNEYVVIEKGQKTLYVHLIRALYGLLVSSMLFYRKLSTALTDDGFVINPYDPCVANKMVNGKQLTITWHVDDVKSSHADPKVNDQFLEWVRDKFGAIGEVKTIRGHVHDYLGMVLDYSVKGQVSIDMSRYVKSMVESFPKEGLKGGTGKTPWNDDLFRVDDTSPRLPPDKAEIFHRVTAQGLFLCKRARPDISPVIAYLTTRVQCSNEDDWSKLCRMMRFLKRTMNDKLTLKADGTNRLLWYVDASFAVHPDYRSHTGATFTMGFGAISSISRKQSMNTRSSTEAEVVAADDIVGAMLWTRQFLEAQGYLVRENVLYQDNQAAMLLESNGRRSAGKRSRHLNIKFFYVHDQKRKGHITIEYCPTDKMTGDYMTKPTHGLKFEEHRQSIMNLPLAMQMVMISMFFPSST